MSDTVIRAAIESRLNTWAAAQSPAIPVAWENAEFTPPAGTYLRGYLMPADNGSTYLEGGDVLRVGMYQISVCVPEGTGTATFGAIVAALETLFPAGLRLTAGANVLMVTKPVEAKIGMPEGTRHIVPCRFRYRLHKT